MAYSKEYYEAHKEQWKVARDKYRKGTPEALERTRKTNRDRYAALPLEKKQELLKRQKEYRKINIEATRTRYKINLRKKQIKQYDKNLQKLRDESFMLKMKDTWDSADFRYADELDEKTKLFQKKIDKKSKEIEVLTKELEELL